MAASSSQSFCLPTLIQEASTQEKPRARGRMVVHVATMPLRVPPGPLQWALSSADRLLSVQHFYTILQPVSDRSLFTVFDFQPRDPEDLATVLIALSGGTFPGVVLKRTMALLPSRRCWKVGVTKDRISLDDAVEFNKNWDTTFQLWTHDCRHHTDAFVEFLTGKKEVSKDIKTAIY